MADKQRIIVEQALIGENYSLSGPVEIVLSNGRIEVISPSTMPQGNRLLAMPWLADAHTHAQPMRAYCNDKS